MIIRFIVNRLNISASDREVVEHLYRAMGEDRRGPEYRDARKNAYRKALAIHHENQEMYRFVTRR